MRQRLQRLARDRHEAGGGGGEGAGAGESEDEEKQRQLERAMMLQEERERQWLQAVDEDAQGGGGAALAGRVQREGGDWGEAAANRGRGDGAEDEDVEVGGESAGRTGVAVLAAVGWVLKLNMAWLDSMADDEMLQRKVQRDLSSCLSDMSPPVNPRYCLRAGAGFDLLIGPPRRCLEARGRSQRDQAAVFKTNPCALRERPLKLRA